MLALSLWAHYNAALMPAHSLTELLAHLLTVGLVTFNIPACISEFCLSNMCMFTAETLTCYSMRATGVVTLTLTLSLALFKCQDNVTVRQDEQYQDPQTEAAKWNSAIVGFMIYTCSLKRPYCVKSFKQNPHRTLNENLC